MVLDNDDPDFGVRPYPPWRWAVEQFLAAGFRPGDVIPHEWFYEALGLERPGPDTPKAVADKVELQYVSGMASLRAALLEDNQIDLQSAFAVGYRWVPPGEQSQLATQDFDEMIVKACRNIGRRIVNVDFAALTSEEKRQQTDHQSHIMRMRSMFNQCRRQRRLSPPQAPPESGQNESA